MSTITCKPLHLAASRLKALTAITGLLLTVMLPGTGCSPAGGSHTLHDTHADTVLRTASLSVFTAPDSTVSAARRIMAATADSGVYYRTATLRAIGSLILGMPDTCQALFDQAASYVARNPGDYVTAEQTERDRSLYFNLLGQLDSALIHSHRACEAAVAGQLWDKAIKNYSIIGEAHEMMGRPIEAAASYRRAIQIGDSIAPGRLPEPQILVGLAATYTSMGNFDEADENFALNATRLDSLTPEQQYFHYSTVGNSLYQRRDYTSAIDEFHRAYRRASAVEDPYLMAVAEANIGECMLFDNRLDSAAYYIALARDHFDSMAAADINLTFYMLSLRGDLALRCGDLDGARRLLTRASADTSSVMPRYQAMHYDRLTRYFERTGDYRTALDYQRRGNTIRDSIRTRQALNYASDLEYRYRQDTTILQSQVRIAHKEEEVQRLREWAIGITMALIIIILAIVIRNMIQRRRTNNEALALRTSMQRLRMENISNRVSSHFIFNVLNGVASPQSRRLNQVADLIRKNINLSNKSVVTLQEELDFIDNYVAVERDSLSGEFAYNLRIDGDVDMSREIPAMMIQVFVENAVKHGLRGYDGPKYLDIRIAHPDRHLLIEIVNNGHLHSSAPGTGTGLRVVTQTIHMLNSRNRDKISLDYGIASNTYRVVITIPDDYRFDYMRRL